MSIPYVVVHVNLHFGKWIQRAHLFVVQSEENGEIDLFSQWDIDPQILFFLFQWIQCRRFSSANTNNLACLSCSSPTTLLCTPGRISTTNYSSSPSENVYSYPAMGPSPQQMLSSVGSAEMVAVGPYPLGHLVNHPIMYLSNGHRTRISNGSAPRV